jgi:hypothetical protein
MAVDVKTDPAAGERPSGVPGPNKLGASRNEMLALALAVFVFLLIVVAFWFETR